MTARTPGRHRPGRKGHRVLERLALGPATLSDIYQLINPHGSRVRKLPHMLASMTRAGLLTCEIGGSFEITPLGELALKRLRDGETISARGEVIGRPNARLFATGEPA